MPKQKTHKGLAKRFKVTARRKVMHKASFSGHLMSGKSGARCRRLRKMVQCSESDTKRALRKLNA